MSIPENGPPEGRYVQAGPIRMHYLESVSYTHLTLPTTPYV